MWRDFTYCIRNTIVWIACIFTLYILLLFVTFNNRRMMIWEECVVSPPLMAFFNVEIGRVWDSEGKGMGSPGYEGY